MSRPVKTKSGTLLTTHEELFSEILNKDDNKAGSEQEMRKVKDNNSENETEVNSDPLTKTEIQLAQTQLKNGKTVRLDNINPEVLKVDPEITVEMLCPLLLRGLSPRANYTDRAAAAGRRS